MDNLFLANVGSFALVLGFLISAYAVVAGIIAIRSNNPALSESVKGASIAIALTTTIAIVIMEVFLLSGQFAIQYVAHYTSSDLPLFYRFSALWAGNEGSLLLWAWILSIYSLAISLNNIVPRIKPIALTILNINNLFFLFLLSFISKPFVILNPPPVEGNGLNPLLQNPGMVIHPITVYLGYVGFAVPFAFAMAAVIAKYPGDEWIKVTRRWTVLAWLFLSLGNLTGMEWAYVELGWGGYWAWDPVENASFMPWLTGSAFLHSVMVQERKDMLKVWNIFLISITYVLTLFGTFLTRSGILSSVHAFADQSLGRYFLVFTVLALFGSLYLLIDRLNFLREGKEFESVFSKESSFLLNNLLLVGAAFATFWGTTFPLFSELVTGEKVTVGAPFFNTVNVPIFLAFILLMGICPLIAWRKASVSHILRNFTVPLFLALAVIIYLLVIGIRKPWAVASYFINFFVLFATLYEIFKGVKTRVKLTGENFVKALINLFVKNRRRYGGYIIHIGLVLIAIGITGSSLYDIEKNVTLTTNEKITIKNYTIEFKGLREVRMNNVDAVVADIDVYQDGKYLTRLNPSKNFYPNEPNPTSEVAIKGSLKEDLYVVLAGWENQDTAIFKIKVNPLIAWIWIGGYFLIFGTVFALWPGKGAEMGPRVISGLSLAKEAE
ncbi:cytochrome c biogenesis protein [Carboxydothermus islandicus]|uniref:Cytochrome c biogenesis protein n=1 Tax=Carboxydothermus islandicus TaxID=661089 RepID=A0A1L8D3T6_9THEO|nr:heme lyase CcmF/NrfE family subunit [Carboxydothermus islandicus]GAV25866.1 cytochrome c biogenesis protein [Carboxydothermus islandicus]